MILLHRFSEKIPNIASIRKFLAALHTGCSLLQQPSLLSPAPHLPNSVNSKSWRLGGARGRR